MQPSIGVGPTLFHNGKLIYSFALVLLAKWIVVVDLSPSSSQTLIFTTSTPFRNLRLWFYLHKYGSWNDFRSWICPRLHLNRRNPMVFNMFRDLGRKLWSCMFSRAKLLETMDIPLDQSQPLIMNPAQCYNTPAAFLIEGWSHEIQGAGTLTELPSGP